MSEELKSEDIEKIKKLLTAATPMIVKVIELEMENNVALSQIIYHKNKPYQLQISIKQGSVF